MNDVREAVGQPTESTERTDGRPTDGMEWLTVTQLAERRGISRASAARLIRRYKWPRRVDNLTRTTSYLVPTHAMEESGRPTEASAVTALREAVALAREQFDALTIEQDSLRIRLDAAEAERDDLRGRLEASADSLRAAEQQIATVRYERDQADGAAQELRERAEQLKAAETARKARGLLQRLRGAWRGE